MTLQTKATYFSNRIRSVYLITLFAYNTIVLVDDKIVTNIYIFPQFKRTRQNYRYSVTMKVSTSKVFCTLLLLVIVFFKGNYSSSFFIIQILLLDDHTYFLNGST